MPCSSNRASNMKIKTTMDIILHYSEWDKVKWSRQSDLIFAYFDQFQWLQTLNRSLFLMPASGLTNQTYTANVIIYLCRLLCVTGCILILWTVAFQVVDWLKPTMFRNRWRQSQNQFMWIAAILMRGHEVPTSLGSSPLHWSIDDWLLLDPVVDQMTARTQA